MKKILAVVGATASGKTALSLALAKQYHAEIISCDSMQIYRHMNIGTAKPTIQEQMGIPHHLLDICEPSLPFSCADYVTAAREKIEDITQRGHLPLFCGGTGLYLDSVLTDTSFVTMKKDWNYCQQLQIQNPEILYAQLQEIDPKTAERLHPNNVKRVIRALEIFHSTGKTKTQWDNESRPIEAKYDTCILGLEYADRDQLYQRINQRVDLMLQAGLLEEIKGLLEQNLLSPESTAYQAIGYKELIVYLKGKCTLSEAMEQLKTNTRHYAKRQMTWFRRNPNIHWILVEKETTFKDIVNNAQELLTNDNFCAIV